MNGVVYKRPPHRKGAPARAKPWAFSIDLGSDAAGKRRQVWRSGFATKREATAAMNAELGHRQAGSYVEPSVLTVGAFLAEQWLPGLTKIRPSTVRGYRGHIQFYLVPALGGTRLSALGTPMINRLYADLQHGTGRGGRTLSASTIRRVHATLHSALADAVRWRLIPYNSAHGAQLPSVARAEMQVWSGEEL